MKNRFVVSVHSKEDQEEAFNKFLTDKKFIYWHWIPHTWLIVTPTNITLPMMFDYMKLAFPTKVFTIHQVTTNKWHINATAEGIKWLKENWFGDMFTGNN